MCKHDDPELCEDEGSDLKIIFRLIDYINKQFLPYGACFSIIGNHELMNVEGDLDMLVLEFRDW